MTRVVARWSAWLSVLVLMPGCAEPAPAISPSPTASRTVERVVAPSPSPLASASPNAPPPASPPAEPPPAPIDPPAAFRALFERGRRFTYRVVDDVDPHGPQGGHIVTRTTVDCSVDGVRTHPGALESVLACKQREPDGADLDDIGFVATRDGIWSTTPDLLDAIAKAGPLPSPLLEAKPRPRRRTYAEPGMFPESGDVDRCTEAVEVSGPTSCHETFCDVARGYGDTRDRRCFGPRGMESMRRENLEGPRVTTWTLVETTAPARGPS